MWVDVVTSGSASEEGPSVTSEHRQPSRKQLRQPRLADIVAKSLRERIVSGEMPDGSSLPTLDGLLQEFGVSPPSVREALRILESEGLISIRRGNVGGAVVHAPKVPAAAYSIGMILQSKRVEVSDLEKALAELEPLCAGFCARRPDRAKEVVPDLRATCVRGRELIEDPQLFGLEMRRFHRLLVKRCGNETLVVVVGALESLWGLQLDTWAHRIVTTDEAPDMKTKEIGLRSHESILDAIAGGKADFAEQLVRDHVAEPDVYATTSNYIVQVTDIPLGAVGGGAPG